MNQKQKTQQNKTLKFQPCDHPCVWQGKETCRECLNNNKKKGEK